MKNLSIFDPHIEKHYAYKKNIYSQYMFYISLSRRRNFGAGTEEGQ